MKIRDLIRTLEEDGWRLTEARGSPRQYETYETERLMKKAIEFHLEGLREDGIPIPEPTTRADYITAA
jgi:hypothetical protein